MNIGNLTITVNLKNDAGITSEMVEALGRCIDIAAVPWSIDPEERDLAQEAMRRLRIVTGADE